MYKKGFTLIELLVVVAIIGVLATIILSSLSSARARARDANRVSAIKQMQTALEVYYLDNGHYPIAAGMASTCSSNNFGSASWAQLTSDLSPYMVIPQADVTGNTTGYSGTGLCYQYNTNSGSSGVCGGNTFSGIAQGYCMYWAQEETVIDSFYYDHISVGGNDYAYHRVFQPQ